MRKTTALAAAAATLLVGSTAIAQTDLRVAGNFSGNEKHVDGVERPFFGSLSEESGIDLNVSYSPMDVLGVKADNALRLLKTGAFDIMSVQVGMASRDDAFFEGIDLAGVAPDMDTLRDVVDAYREPFDKRLQERFNAKVLTLWPFGPQTIYCNADISGPSDFEGKKVRVFTPSMATLIDELGGTSVTLQFSEVYPALQRNVADCAITAPTAGNSAKWPEVTSHFVPLAVTGSVQGHFINLDKWESFSQEEQEALMAEFQRMEDAMWDLATKTNQDAIDCNVGRDSCSNHTKYDMELVEVTDQMESRVKQIAAETIVPNWLDKCTGVKSDCKSVWQNTAGNAANIELD